MKLLSERLAHIYSERPDLDGERGQTSLVRASRASKSVVNQWLTGKIKSIDIMYALNIEAELGYSHIWLMTGLGVPKVGDVPSAAVMQALHAMEERTELTRVDPRELRLLTWFREADGRGKIDILDRAERAEKELPVRIRKNKPK